MFNIYCHQSVLAVRGEGKKKNTFLHSSDGATQGCSLAMVDYCVLLHQLIIELKSKFPKVKSP